MQFQEAIRTCFSKYADFTGCARRPEFWYWYLFVVVGQIALGVVSSIAAGVFAVGTLLPYFAVSTRRLHDTDRSGWWQLLMFLPVIGWLVLLYWFYQPSVSPTRYDRTGMQIDARLEDAR